MLRLRQSRIIAPGRPVPSLRLFTRDSTFKPYSQVNLKSSQDKFKPTQGSKVLQAASEDTLQDSLQRFRNNRTPIPKTWETVHFSFRIPTLQRSYETESSRRLCPEARDLFHSPKLASLWPFTRPRPFKNRISFPSREVPFSQLFPLQRSDDLRLHRISRRRRLKSLQQGTDPCSVLCVALPLRSPLRSHSRPRRSRSRRRSSHLCNLHSRSTEILLRNGGWAVLKSLSISSPALRLDGSTSPRIWISDFN